MTRPHHAPREQQRSRQLDTPSRPGSKRRPLVLVVGTMTAVGAALTGCAASGSTAAKDVTITACTPSPTNSHPTAGGQILNHSSKASSYTIHVKFSDSAGNDVGDGFAAVAKVNAGTTATWHADGSLNAKGPVKCAVTSVTRTLSP